MGVGGPGKRESSRRRRKTEEEEGEGGHACVYVCVVMIHVTCPPPPAHLFTSALPALSLPVLFLLSVRGSHSDTVCVCVYLSVRAPFSVFRFCACGLLSLLFFPFIPLASDDGARVPSSTPAFSPPCLPLHPHHLPNEGSAPSRWEGGQDRVRRSVTHTHACMHALPWGAWCYD